MDTYTLLHLKWITNKDLLYSTWNSAQPGWEGGLGRMDTCICMAESLSCSSETTTGLLIGYSPIQNRRRQWHPTPVLLPGKSHGWRSLVDWGPWGHEESDTTEDFTLTFHFHALEKEMAAYSSVLAWRIPGTAEPGGLTSTGLHRLRHDWSNLAAAAGAAAIQNKSSQFEKKTNK